MMKKKYYNFKEFFKKIYCKEIEPYFGRMEKGKKNTLRQNRLRL